MADVTKKRSIWKSGCAVFLVLLIAGAGAAIFFANRWLDNTDYRRLAEEAITDAVGMPTTIADLDVVIFPTPAVRAEHIRIGTDTFYATVDLATAHGDLRAISDQLIRITDVTLENPIITLPDDVDEIIEWADRLRGDGEGSSMWSIAIDNIAFTDAHIRQGEAGDWATISGTVQNVLDEGTFAFDGTLPIFGDEATINANGTLSIDGGIMAENLVNGIRLATIDPALESFGEAEARVDISSADWLVWQGNLDGKSSDAAVTATAQWAEATLAINDIALTGDGIEVRGDATRHPDGGIGLLIGKGYIDPDRLTAMVRDATDGALQLTGGALALEALYAGVDAEGAILLSEGAVTLANADLSAEGDRVIARNTNLKATVQDNALVIDSLTAEGIDLIGRVTPLPDWDGAHIALEGRASLSDGLLAPLDLGPGVHDISGTANIKSAAATITGGGLPEDLRVVGTLEKGSVAIDFGDSFTEGFSGVGGSFTTNGKIVQVDMRGTGKQMGAFHLKSDIDTTGQNLNGTLAGNAAKLGAPAYWNEWARETLEPVLATYGDVTLEWRVQLPTDARKELSVTAAIPSDGSRRLHGDVYLKQIADGTYQLSVIDVHAGFPSSALDPMAEPMVMNGWTNLSFTKPANAETFEVAVDLSGADLKLPPYVHLAPNAAGSNLPRVRVTGTTGTWAAEKLIVDLAPSVRAVGRFTENGAAFDDINIPLTDAVPYFPPGTLADGIIRGSIVSTPLDVNLTFDDVRVAPGGGLEPVAVDGAIRVTDTAWDIPKLDIRGANSDAHIEGSQRGGTWTGNVKGSQLDISAVRTLLAQWTTSDTESDANQDPVAAESTSIRIGADVAFQNVLYTPAEGARTLTLTNVSSQVAYDDGGVRLDNLKATPYTGTLSGSVGYNDQDILALNLMLRGVSARAVDEMFFVEPRNLSGSIDGDVVLSVPMNDDPAAGLTGKIQLQAAKGTLGSMGIATQILDLLRTIQIWNLFGGWKRENGLVYDTLNTSITAQSGVMQIEEFRLANSYLAIRGGGIVDFARRDSKVPMEIEVLEGIFKPVQAVPVVGQTAGKVGVISAEMTGSPYEPKVAATGMRGFQNLGDQIRGAGTTIEEEVVNRVLQGIGNLIRRKN